MIDGPRKPMYRPSTPPSGQDFSTVLAVAFVAIAVLAIGVAVLRFVR